LTAEFGCFNLATDAFEFKALLGLNFRLATKPDCLCHWS